MPFHQAFTTGLSPEVLMSGDSQQAGLGPAMFPAGLRMQHCHQYMCTVHRLLKEELKCSLTVITHYDTLATQREQHASGIQKPRLNQETKPKSFDFCSVALTPNQTLSSHFWA